MINFLQPVSCCFHYPPEGRSYFHISYKNEFILEGVFVTEGESGRAREGHWVVMYCWLVTWGSHHTHKMDYVMKIFIEYDCVVGRRHIASVQKGRKEGWRSETQTFLETFCFEAPELRVLKREELAEGKQMLENT